MGLSRQVQGLILTRIMVGKILSFYTKYFGVWVE